MGRTYKKTPSIKVIEERLNNIQLRLYKEAMQAYFSTGTLRVSEEAARHLESENIKTLKK